MQFTIFTITEDWLGDHGVGMDDFMAAMEEAGFNPYPNDDGAWIFTAADNNSDGIPDFIANLVTDPINTNPSQGGAAG